MMRVVPAAVVLGFFVLTTLAGEGPVLRAQSAASVVPVSSPTLVLKPANAFDLAGRTIAFRPRPGGGYDVSSRPVEPFVPVGRRLQRSAGVTGQYTDSWRIALPFAFPFASAQWQEVFVNLTGSISFGRSEVDVWDERDFWSDGTMRSMAAAFDARAAVGSELLVAAFWGIYATDTEVTVDVNAERAVFTWRGLRRTSSSNVFHDPLGRNEFRATLFPSGQIEFDYWEVAERDGISGVFTRLPSVSRRLDVVEEPGDAPHPTIEIERVELTDEGTTLRARFTMAADIPARVDTGSIDYRFYVEIDGRRCSVRFRVDGAGRRPASGCGPAPRTIGARVDGRHVDLVFSKSLFHGRGSWTWVADAVWWGFDRRYDQVSFARSRPISYAANAGPDPVDLSASGGGDGTVFEIFHYPVVSRLEEQLTSEIYRQQPPDDDFAIIATDFRFDDIGTGGPGSGALNVPISGIGAVFAQPGSGTAYGSPRLQATFSPFYPVAPRFRRTVPGVAGEYPYVVNWIAHELAHRWLVHVRWRNPATGLIHTLENEDCSCHWSDWLHAPPYRPVGPDYAGATYVEHSPMGGAFWEENADATFTRRLRNNVPSGFSALDLYAMGALSPEDVPETFYLMNAQAAGASRYRGTKVPVRIEDIISVEGPRVPSSRDAPRDFSLGVYLIHEHGRGPRSDMIERVSEIVSAFERYMPLATAGRLRISRTVGAPLLPAPMRLPPPLTVIPSAPGAR